MNAFQQPAGIGHNSSTIDALDPGLITDQLTLDHAKLIQRRDELLASFEAWKQAVPGSKIEDETLAARTTDFCAQLKACFKSAEAARKDAKAPFDTAAQTVQAFFARGIQDRLDAPIKALERALTDFARRKEALARAEAERQAKEAREEADRLARAAEAAQSSDLMEQAVAVSEEADRAQHVAQGRPAELGQVRGTYGGVSALRARWTFEVTDKLALVKAVADGRLPLTFLDICAPTINGAIKSGLRDTDALGLRIYEDKSVSVR